MIKKIFIKSYGCQMNVYDSQRMFDIMKPEGYHPTNMIEDANLVVLNTCHIREKASEKVYSEIGRINKIKNKKKSLKKEYLLVIAGCVAQAEGEAMKIRAPSIDAIVGPQSFHKLPEILKNIKKRNQTIVKTEFLANKKFDELIYNNNSNSSAFVTIQEGCDKFCTFCVVPYTRGSEYSRPINEILKEVKNYTGSGVKEVVLLGQNVNAYHGNDIDKNERSFSYLINKISEIEKIKRIRYMTSHPLDMHEDLINDHKYNPKLMPFVHMPIQSGSDKILKSMNRKYNVNEYVEIIDKLINARNDIAISSDFIVGFPGETDDDFKKTVELVKKIEFAISYSFSYSSRPGTPASKLSNQIERTVKKERLKILQSVLNKQQKKYNKNFIGKSLDVLIEKKGRHKNQYVGRSIYNQSVFMNSENNIKGDIIKARIDNVTTFALSGNIIN
ncbi:MAG: tRNA-2-methylthio-N(6)-dimethylallyladenosine synthase [Alphaproteobacteria bacterium MarineAlpha5_Bin11]|nr:tRNA (N6-isopentenyl adenosine(37)-C2)-methylthiotransferase MiaB [Pelagibacteraceae bacterium]PPR45143.1 MAG: tRNA-2-methylthio-N(6)-dimethylallyladenosine synthase [Alphaproteobacteria bacterium MarineAlpha5_Bin11]PPR52115.1 MAG: tRNA-2-methylthio-N(6)-dimethylallyladenosine synthase [Alphaproteobacteria bacterium MarineAlpha5_Bin10]